MSKSQSRNLPYSKPEPSSGSNTVVKSGLGQRARTVRETVESIVIAFVLAFLIRTFEAEAFVIPTGSMAPTLQGRHKDVECPKCGFPYQASASNEVSDSGNEARRVIQTTCPQCSFPLNVDPATADGREYPSHNGDRILVGKFSYQFDDPKRWDVMVFKYPQEANVNYIKRLVGLPGETVRISRGNIYTRGPHQPEELQDQFVIQRKPDDKQLAMLQMVHDNQYQPSELIAAGWPTNWAPQPGTQTDAWTMEDENRRFAVNQSSGDSAAWLRYRHYVPQHRDWSNLATGSIVEPRPKLITDHYAYNDYVTDPRTPRGMLDEWVSDLAVELNLDVQESRGELTLELVRGGEPLRAKVNLATGEVDLLIPSIPEFSARAQTSLNKVGQHSLMFTNVDDELRLYISGKQIEFDRPTTYDPTADMLQPIDPQQRFGPSVAYDSEPVGIGVAGAKVEISSLKVLRDIHYRATFSQFDTRSRDFTDFELRKFAEDPGRDQFFVLGDNSPQSLDSRLWDELHFVDRNLLIGKAIYIFWPHPLKAIQLGETKIPFPLVPNIGRMEFVR